MPKSKKKKSSGNSFSLHSIDAFLNRMNEEQLRELNRKVVEKLNLFQKVKRLQAISNFSVLDKVSFIHNGEEKHGTITRLNQKTVTIITDDDEHWNVNPSLLKKRGKDIIEV